MAMRRFHIEAFVEFDLTIDEQVISVVDDEWRKALYNLHTPEEIAEMVGLNLLEGKRLSMLDGWADQPDTNASISWSVEFHDVDVQETTK